MESNYINKVLSHLKNKDSKRQLEAELADHIELHQDLYAQIGYDNEQAIALAEEKMGDADVAGEQLALLEREKKGRDKILIFDALLSLCLFLFHGEDDISQYLIFNVFFLLGMINLLFGIKYKKYLNALFGAGSAICALIGYSRFFGVFVQDFVTKREAYLTFFELDNTAISESLVPDVINIAVGGMLGIIAIISCILTKRLRKCNNTRADGKIARVLMGIVGLMMLFSATVFAYNTVSVFTNRSVIQAHIREELQAYDKALLTHIDEIEKGDFSALEAIDSSYVTFEAENMGDYYFAKVINTTQDLGDGNLMPYNTEQEIATQMKKAENADFTVNDITLPFEMTVKVIHGSTFLRCGFSTYFGFMGSFEDDNFRDYIDFDNEQDGTLRISPAFIAQYYNPKAESVKLSPAKQQAVQKLLDACQQQTYFSDLRYNEKEDMYTEVYPIDYAALFDYFAVDDEILSYGYSEVSRLYQVELIHYSSRYAVINGKLFELEEPLTEPMLLRFGFDGDEAILYQGPEEYSDYEDAEENFTAEGYQKLAEAFSRDELKDQTALAEAYFNQSLYGSVENIYQDGTFTYHRYQNGELTEQYESARWK